MWFYFPVAETQSNNFSILYCYSKHNLGSQRTCYLGIKGRTILKSFNLSWWSLKEERKFSLTWSASLTIELNKRKRLLRKELNYHRIGLEKQHGNCLLFWNTKMTAASFLPFHILLHFLHIFRKAFVLNTANKNLSWYSSIKVNTEFKQQRRRRLRKRNFKVNSRCLKLYRAYSISFNSSNVGDFFWSWILRDCIEVQEKECVCLAV